MERPEPNRDLADLERRVGNVVHLGTIKEADYSRPRVRVRIGPLLTGWVPFTTARAGEDRTWHPPEKDEQVVLVAPGGDLAQAVVVGAVYRNKFPANGDRPTLDRVTYRDGTVLEYDRAAHQWNATVNPAGHVRFNIGGSVLTMTDAKITLASNGSTLEMDAAGIRLNGARIDLN